MKKHFQLETAIKSSLMINAIRNVEEISEYVFKRVVFLSEWFFGVFKVVFDDCVYYDLFSFRNISLATPTPAQS